MCKREWIRVASAALLLCCCSGDDEPKHGSAGEPCFPNGTCNKWLRCESGVCVEIPQGEEDGPCYPNDTCDQGLDCLDGVCIDDSVCGNGVLEHGEECDGVDFGGFDCTDFNCIAGALSCTGYCKIDTSACSGCR